MFLAVAQVNAQDEADYGVEATPYEAAPEPDFTFGDAAVEITIPEDGSWAISSAVFELGVVAEGDAVLDWSDGLDEDLADYAAEVDGYVLYGQAEIDAVDGETYALGLQGGTQSSGILAVAAAGEFYTVYFDSADAVDGDLDAEPAWISAEPNNVDGLADNSGVGDSWGQSLDGTTWSLWSYNGNDSSEDWEDGSFDVVYLESSEGVWSSFTDSIDLAAAGASRLLATATTASLLLALM